MEIIIIKPKTLQKMEALLETRFSVTATGRAAYLYLLSERKQVSHCRPLAKKMMLVLRCKAIQSAFGGLAPQPNHRWLVATANNGILRRKARP